MDQIQAAIDETESLDQRKEFSYTRMAVKFNVDRSTLCQRHQGSQAPRETQAIKQQRFNPQ
jgi:hypothetical protein